MCRFEFSWKTICPLIALQICSRLSTSWQLLRLAWQDQLTTQQVNLFSVYLTTLFGCCFQRCHCCLGAQLSWDTPKQYNGDDAGKHEQCVMTFTPNPNCSLYSGEALEAAWSAATSSQALSSTDATAAASSSSPSSNAYDYLRTATFYPDSALEFLLTHLGPSS